MKLPTMGEALRISAQRFPTKIALRDEQRAFTYTELNRRTNRLAHWLQQLGLQRGDLLAVVLGNRLEYAEAVYAAAKLGVVTVPMDVHWGAAELRSMASFFQPTAAVVDATLTLPGGPLDQEAVWPDDRMLVVDDFQTGSSNYDRQALEFSDDEPTAEVNGDDLFMLMLTSGTTGRPKACNATHHTFVLRCLNYAIGGESALTTEDVYLSAMPLYFNAGRGSLIGHLFHGASVVLLPRFEPHSYLRSIAQHGATSLYMVPTMCERLVSVMPEQRYDVSSVRVIRTTGAALHETTRRELEQLFNCRIYDGYGSTDTGAIAHPERGHQQSPPGSCGRVIWGTELAIVDDLGNHLATGEQGEVLIRGPLVCDGYYQNPEANAASFHDGWFFSGDIGYLDQAGYLFLTGRKKNMVKSGGVSIYPEEIEDVLKRYPGVGDAVVVGLPDSAWGEAVHALVVPLDDEQVSAEALIAHCKQQLAPYKAPKSIVFAPELPQTSVAKIDRAAVRELLLNGGSSAAN